MIYDILDVIFEYHDIRCDLPSMFLSLMVIVKLSIIDLDLKINFYILFIKIKNLPILLLIISIIFQIKVYYW